MFAQQREFGLVVIECGFLPVLLGMAGLALGPELVLVRLFVVLLVANVAHLGRVLVLLVDVTLVALHFLVLAQQRILGLLVVIEQDILPVLRGVARLALRTELALVRLVVVLLVARLALQRRVLELVVDVALVALHVDVLARQLELGLVVIEGDCLPVFFDMAL